MKEQKNGEGIVREEQEELQPSSVKTRGRKASSGKG